MGYAPRSFSSTSALVEKLPVLVFGRISSTEPNMQNIPVRTELGKEMRKFFVAPRGRILLDADYSQIELRILANLCEDANMQQAFLSGADIHASTAAQVFGVPREAVTPQMRSAAKAVNFGIVYGIGAYSLGENIGVSYKEAQDYINSYLRHYSGVDPLVNAEIIFSSPERCAKTRSSIWE